MWILLCIDTTKQCSRVSEEILLEFKPKKTQDSDRQTVNRINDTDVLNGFKARLETASQLLKVHNPLFSIPLRALILGEY
jgi:hypothetical protein